MGKDHIPGSFNRSDGYMSDLEKSETRSEAVRINTSFGSNNHNVYIHDSEGTHEHYWYDPGNARSGYHGENVQTRNNHPNGNVSENMSENGGEKASNMKIVTSKEYGNMVQQMKEGIGYENLTESLQNQFDAQIDQFLASKGVVVEDANELENMTQSQNMADETISQISNENVSPNSQENSEEDSDSDDMQNRDEINDGHPYSLNDEMDELEGVSQESLSDENSYEIEL